MIEDERAEVQWSEEAEKAVLGAIFFRPECLARIDLEPSDFFAPAHRAVIETMRAISLDKQKIDPLTVGDGLGDKLGAVGGFPYLTSLMNDPLTADNVDYYAEIVKRKALSRSVRLAASSVVSSDLEGEKLLAKFQAAVGEVAKRLPDDSMTMAELARATYRDVAERLEGKKREVYATGFRDLDAMLGGGLEIGSVTTVGGATSHGKSAILRGMANNLAATGVGVDGYVLESTLAALGRRALADHSEIELQRIRTFDKVKSATRNEVVDMIAATDALTLYNWRLTQRAGMSCADLMLRVRRHKEELNTKVVVVDYLQLIDEKASSLREQVSKACKGLKALALNEGVAVLTASQLKRKPAGARPTLQDLRESGDIEQDSDNVLLIHHVEKWHGVILAKQRDGLTGDVRLGWDKQFTAWRDFRGAE